MSKCKYTLLLKGKEILALSGESNAHRLSLKAQVSYPTVDRYINHPETLTAYGCETLAAILVDGAELSPQEILAMPMSTFFDIVDVDEK
jgi:hypothetical protein